MIPISRPQLPALGDYQRLLAEIWDSRMLSNFGPFARKLEQISADYLGVPTRAVASGDVGLILSLAALDLPPGSAVVVPSFTFNSTVNAVLWNGLQPVFADISPRRFTLDPGSAAEAVALSNAAAVIATHVFGNPADEAGLQRVADEAGTRLLYDAAHAYGALRDGSQVGQFGNAEIFSLSGTKLITTAEGGLVASRDETLLARIDYLRAYGFRTDYNSLYVGLNGKMSELHAALGTLTLPTVEAAVERRQAIANSYRAALGHTSLEFQDVRSADRSTFKDFALLFNQSEVRDRVEAALTSSGVQTKRYFRPCHTQHAYAHLARVSLQQTEDVYSRILCIPIFAEMTSEQIDHVTRVTEAAIK